MNSSEDEDDTPDRPPPSTQRPNQDQKTNHNSDSSYSDDDGVSDDEWDENTDDIHSLASEDLHGTRPNRWTGAASTWRGYTERERRTYAALLGERRGDLGGHLFDAWKLRGRVGEEAETDGEGENGSRRGKQWPPVRWTAWPIRASDVPGDGLMAEAMDEENEQYTLRRPELGWPSENLEDEISATVLRLAKEKFQRRDLQGNGKEEQQLDPDAIQTIETDGFDEMSEGEGAGQKEEEEDTYTPIPMADDELSHSILHPATRRILARLDDMLTILHNSRMAATRIMAEPEPDDTETEPGSAKRGRPRRESAPKKHQSPSKTGRPRKTHQPRDGESYQDMVLRVARESKRRLPDYYGYETQTDDEAKRRRARSRSGARPATSEDYIDRWALRGWRDVMAAAALAGFSPSVLARATQRCSTLFGQDMTLHTLPEQPKEPGIEPMQTAKYTPDARPIESSEEEDNAEVELEQLRAVSRQPSVRPSSPETEGSSRRRRSATPGGGRQDHFCPHASCPRAINGFSRKGNLARHIKTMHGGGVPHLMTVTGEESADEMDGAIHKDRFLQIIKTRRGWRAEDLERGRVRNIVQRYRTRTRERSSDDNNHGTNYSSD
ncbi:hypothetical protein B0T14DRAFT_418827 [Immersiella caudata]|uniref:Rrn9 domain-containing protein n=1 Tax=Immersiella caudata TaxID=314043 RepID=A0AA39XCY5_9PEZI|nr:hypothetical protein B0T14DRAFT_418827 [Immersiella caudata]